MKASSIFKILLNILLLLLFFNVIDFYILPFYNLSTGETMICRDWDFMTWVFLIIIAFIYTLFFIGAFFLCRMGRELIKEYYFSRDIIRFLKVSGNYFVISGSLLLLIHISMIIYGFYYELNPVFDFTVTDPLFLMIVGLFFKIQSKSLSQAKIYKDEFDLTI